MTARARARERAREGEEEEKEEGLLTVTKEGQKEEGLLTVTKEDRNGKRSQHVHCPVRLYGNASTVSDEYE